MVTVRHVSLHRRYPSITYAEDIIRLLRRDAESGDAGARQVTAFAEEYLTLAAQREPDRRAVAELLTRLEAAAERGGSPYLANIDLVVRRMHLQLNVMPFLPTTRVVGVDAAADMPLFTIREPVAGEGRFVRQSGCPSKYGHVLLRLEPLPGEQILRLDWLASEEDVPKEFMEQTFDGIAAAAERLDLDRGGKLAAVRVAVTGGSWHEVDSSPFCYKVAGALALPDAIARACLVPLPR